MFPLNTENFCIKIAKMKHGTTALGGSISIIDEIQSKSQGKEVLERLPVPYSVVTDLKKKHKSLKFLVAIPVAIMYYQDTVVAIELCDTSDKDVDKWTPYMMKNLVELDEMTEHDDWYIDGRFAYKFTENRNFREAVDKGTYLTHDGMFRSVPVNALKLTIMSSPLATKTIGVRECVAFVNSDHCAVSPPVWTSLAQTGRRKFAKAQKYLFDSIDNELHVNLAFVLKAGTTIGKVFGYEEIEPLQLPELMVRLKTVNLPNVDKSVKETYNVGLKFTHSIAWLMGLMDRISNFTDYMSMRSVLVYLSTKGIFRSNLFDHNQVYKSGESPDTIEVISREQALESAERSSGMVCLVEKFEEVLVAVDAA